MQTFEWGMFGLSDLVPHVRRVRKDGLLAETPHLLVSARPAKDVFNKWVGKTVIDRFTDIQRPDHKRNCI